jgi:carbonic anhydrase
MSKEFVSAVTTGSRVGHANGFKLASPEEPTAGSLDVALARNRAFAAAGGHEGAVVFPNLRLFVITCLDPRVDPAHFLGLGLRTGALADDGFRRRYAERIGASESDLREHAVLDPAATVTHDVELLRFASAVSSRVSVSGHVYDVVTGRVQTLLPARPKRPLAPRRNTLTTDPESGDDEREAPAATGCPREASPRRLPASTRRPCATGNQRPRGPRKATLIEASP